MAPRRRPAGLPDTPQSNSAFTGTGPTRDLATPVRVHSQLPGPGAGLRATRRQGPALWAWVSRQRTAPRSEGVPTAPRPAGLPRPAAERRKLRCPSARRRPDHFRAAASVPPTPPAPGHTLSSRTPLRAARSQSPPRGWTTGKFHDAPCQA